MNPPNEPVHCIYGSADLAIHTSARVEKNTDADWNISILTEVRNVLCPAVFFKNEVIFGQVWDISAAAVRNGHDDIHQPHVDSNLCRKDRAKRQSEIKCLKAAPHLDFRGLPGKPVRGLYYDLGYDRARMISSDEFRRVMGNFATGITVVTTRDAEGQPCGLTVNSFTSVSLEPVLVLVCFDKRLSNLEAFKDSKRFGISMLSKNQEDLSRMFAKRESERPASLYFEGRLGMPLIKNSLAVMECETIDIYPGGDHLIFVGEVKNAEVQHPEEPLLYFRGKYRTLHGG